MEVDTGSSKSIIAWHTLKKIAPELNQGHLRACNRRLCDYQGNNIPILGHAHFLVEKGIFSGHPPLLVVKGKLPSLLELDWFKVLGLNH